MLCGLTEENNLKQNIIVRTLCFPGESERGSRGGSVPAVPGVGLVLLPPRGRPCPRPAHEHVLGGTHHQVHRYRHTQYRVHRRRVEWGCCLYRRVECIYIIIYVHCIYWGVRVTQNVTYLNDEASALFYLGATNKVYIHNVYNYTSCI